jgi:hypothetical protein
MSRHVTFMTIDDAEHYTAEERAHIVAAYPPHERAARARRRSPCSTHSLARSRAGRSTSEGTVLRMKQKRNESSGTYFLTAKP